MFLFFCFSAALTAFSRYFGFLSFGTVYKVGRRLSKNQKLGKRWGSPEIGKLGNICCCFSCCAGVLCTRLAGFLSLLVWMGRTHRRVVGQSVLVI